MAVSPRLENYLCQAHTEYEVIPHGYSESAYDAACSSHIPATHVVKSVILKARKTGVYCSAIVPASNKIKLSWVCNELGKDLMLAAEDELSALFPDCLLGAIPAFSQAYNVDLIWDDQLELQTDLYFEAGNHEEFIHIDRKQFQYLFQYYTHGVISLPADQYSFYHADEVRGSLN